MKDHLGSTRAVVNDGGTVLETFDYYPFGLLMPKRNTAGANTLEKFTGKERDDEGGLNLDYFGARYYDPALGRFLSVDPLADNMPSWNPYHYTFNNPINLIDPLGLMPQDPEELRRFQFDELGDGLAFMWQLSLSGTENAVEVSAYLVEQSNGEVALVVFDNENNTLFTSDNPSIIDGIYNSEEVVAQVHTHPAHPEKSDGNPARFSPEDIRFATGQNVPVFTIGAGGRMASTIGEGTTRVHTEALQWLKNNDNEGFLQTVINRRREQQ